MALNFEKIKKLNSEKTVSVFFLLEKLLHKLLQQTW